MGPYGGRWSPLRGSDDSLRATWRILFPLAVYLAVTYGGGILLLFPALRASGIQSVYGIDLALVGLLGLAGAAAATYFSTRIDGRQLKGYGLGFSREWLTDLAAGLVAGLSVATIHAWYALSLGRGRIVDTVTTGSSAFPELSTLLFLVGMFAVVAQEETIFRGIVLTNAVEGLLSRGLSLWGAGAGGLLVSSLLFVPPHWIGGVTIGESLLTASIGYFLMGLLFALAYLLTGELALPLGLHLAYNLSNGYIFGIAGTVSEGTPSLLVIEYVAAASLELTVVRVVVGVFLIACWVRLSRGEIDVADRFAASS